MGTDVRSATSPDRAATRRVREDEKPWYRQFWPWFLIGLPAVSVVFSFATLYIAVTGADEVVPHEGQFNSFSAPDPHRPSEASPSAARLGCEASADGATGDPFCDEAAQAESTRAP